MATLSQLVITGDYRTATEPTPSSSSNVFAVEVVSGLVDLIPRVPLGTQIYIPSYQVEGNNEVQRVGFLGDPSSGTYTLAFNGSAASTAIPWNASITALRNALEALSTIGVGNVSVTGDPIGDYFVEFQGTLANLNVPLLVANSTSLVGGTCQPVIETTGQPIANRDTSFVLDPVFEARVWEGRLSTINVADTLNITIPAASTEVLASLAQQGINELRYDVRHRKVTYAQAERSLRDFSFAAISAGTINLTSPSLTRGEFAPLDSVLKILP